MNEFEKSWLLIHEEDIILLCEKAQSEKEIEDMYLFTAHIEMYDTLS